MQPTFLPWMGYFGLIEQVDLFLLLDTVQFSKQSWQQRNSISDASGERRYITLPVSRKPSFPLLKAARIASQQPYQEKLLAQLHNSLGKMPHYALVERLFLEAVAAGQGYLARLNLHFIRAVMELLGIRTPLLLMSDWLEQQGWVEPAGPAKGIRKSSFLEAVCGQLQAGIYVSPPSAFAYLDEEKGFAESATALRYFAYSPQPYPQPYLKSGFVSHLSIVDALACLGPEASGACMRAGVQQLLTSEEIRQRAQSNLPPFSVDKA